MLLVSCSFPALAQAAVNTDYIYVESDIQSANGNSILAYSRTGTGAILPLAGSPFATRGAGDQDTSVNIGPYDSDQEIVIDNARKLLFAVNSGSDTIAVFHLNSDGSLTAIPGSPFLSGGVNPVSVGIAGDTLLVVNKNGDGGRTLPVLPNYTTLHIAPDGSLSPFTQSQPVEVAFGSSPSQIQPVTNTNISFGVDFHAGLLQSFLLGENGQLFQRLPTPLPNNPAIPQEVSQVFGFANVAEGLWVHPTLPLVYVGFPISNELGIYSFDLNGVLNLIHTIPVVGSAPCWVRTNKAATRLYTGDAGDINNDNGTVSVFDLTDPTTPKQLQSLALSTPGNTSQIALDPSETTLYAISQRHSEAQPQGTGLSLHAFTVQSDGTLIENIAPVVFNVPIGGQPQGVAVWSPN
jgi:6-phosphogluconolactonase (cycloisomerase 2 family)